MCCSFDDDSDYYMDMLRLCYEEAQKTSSDHSNINAAMIIMQQALKEGDKIVGSSLIPLVSPVANRLPRDVLSTDERTKIRPTKYDFIEHAERGAIYEAARLGKATQDAIMICPWVACADCSRAIVNAGIKKVITHKQRNALTSLGRDKVVDTTSDRWVNPISNGSIILQEAGIEVVYLDFHAGIKTLVNEQWIEV